MRAACIERVERLQKGHSLRPGRGRRRIGEAQGGGIGDAPSGEIEDEAGEVGCEDFGRIEGLEAAVWPSFQRR